ncbi:D-arabinono-1,4-lactone oxidase [Colletotrichum higginsianum]|nr:D-arabinono-1,4-lactone oxidase [Colletotrichum higginsianum]
MDPAIAALLEKSAADGIPSERAPTTFTTPWPRPFTRCRNSTSSPSRSPGSKRSSTSPAGTAAASSPWQLNLDHYARVLSTDASTGLAVVQSGIRLHSLCDELDRRGLAMPNLGSINQ